MKKFVKKPAFSIAEAMITLLIVSIALAAAAPIISKQNKSSITNNYNSIWQKKGQKIYYNDGNVGIGTDNPQEKLSVNGNTAINGNVNINSGKLVIDNTGFNINLANFGGGIEIKNPRSADDTSPVSRIDYLGRANISTLVLHNRVNPDYGLSMSARDKDGHYMYFEHFNGTTSWNSNYNSIMLYKDACPSSGYMHSTGLEWRDLGYITYNLNQTTGKTNSVRVHFCQRVDPANI